MTDTSRLIEHAFPLKQTSLDSVHEKNVRHGHISTLHIWPARRPLAACRAALIATLLPDPGTPEERQALCEKIGGRVVKVIERKKMPNGEIVEREKEETVGGILHWGRETENAADLEWFRQEIRKAYGGRAPRVLDPFSGGGAIPLEAMRLGCEATAIDINPVAWFILKCTLEYPQKLAGQTHPLPDFILDNEEFMDSFYKAHPHLVGRTKQTAKQKKKFEGDLFLFDKEDSGRAPKADLAWHVRAWGQWVLDRARRELAQFYPTYADFEPADPKSSKAYERQVMRLVPLKDDGTADIDKLNAEFSKEYLAEKRNPRWVAKPTVAYLWARTVTCKNCRATIPLLKTRWLSKLPDPTKRVLLTMLPNAKNDGVVFGIQRSVPVEGTNTAQRREHDRRIGLGTMSRSGAQCPCCPSIMRQDDIRIEAQRGGLRAIPLGVVVDAPGGKAYRDFHDDELHIGSTIVDDLVGASRIDLSDFPEQMTPVGASRSTGGSAFTVVQYGLTRWKHLFTERQLASLATFVRIIREASTSLRAKPGAQEFGEAIGAYLSVVFDKVLDRQSTVCRWDIGRLTVTHTFSRFALPILWDYCETNLLSESTGSFESAAGWVAQVIEKNQIALAKSPTPRVLRSSAIGTLAPDALGFDFILTDPPYYDAIPYSDLMDFFYVWLRRTLLGLGESLESEFLEPLGPKWNRDDADGELTDDAGRHDGDAKRSKVVYEEGMYRVFDACFRALAPDGRAVVVFAHKHPDAWETLVSAIIRAGFVVDGSWPIQTEMANRTRGHSAAALASSVWLVCKKRPATARPGWDNQVLDEMRTKIRHQLREFWDAGIRGPDFVWAATGPALEAYSAHPVVRKANEPGPLTVAEFLSHVRRMVIDFVVGRVLTGDKGEVDDGERLDEPTAYYLLHRNDFGLDDAPAGACILYAVSCGLSDKELSDTWDLLASTKGKQPADEDDEPSEDDDADSSDSGSKIKLKTWSQRHGKSMGYEAPGGRPIPLIDRVHRLMQLWKSGELSKVDEYLDSNGLRRQELFKRLLQSLIELSDRGSEERALLESLSNHVQAKGAALQLELR